MIIYKAQKIEIVTLKEEHKKDILKYFSENNFNCDSETGALRPSEAQFEEIMDGIISGKDDENNVFVLKKYGNVIGYISMFVEYDRMTIGHIAVKKSERGRGYGTLLTKMAVLIAENEMRHVNLYCAYPDNCFKKMGFKAIDDVHYFHEREGRRSPSLPKFFVSVEEYKKRQKKKMEEEVNAFSKFLNSDVVEVLKNIDKDDVHRR